MQANESAVDLECRKEGLDLVEYPLYRIVQVLYALLSLTSLPLLLYVEVKHIFGSTFHRNIKTILLTYYSSALLQSTAYSTIQIYEIISSLISKPCDFFPSFYIYAFFHLTSILPFYGMILSLAAMCCERTVATVRSNKYESNGIALSLLLLVVTIVATVADMSYVYEIRDFNAKMWSMIYVPPAAVDKFNQVALLNIFISFVCIATFQMLSRYNEKKYSVRIGTLTTRYQTRENVITTQFASHIATIQVLFFILYGSCGVFVRTFGPKLVSKKLYTSFRQMCFITPVFMIFLPIYSVRKLKYYQLNRDSNIRSIVMMESRGAAGTRNYEEVIGKAWKLNQHE